MAEITAEDRQPRATAIVGLAVGFGVVGDVLFYQSEPGLNASLWLGGLAVAGWLTARRRHRAAHDLALLLAVGVFFAACLAWRASPFLRVWNLAAMGVAVVGVGLRLRGGLQWPRLTAYARGALGVAIDVAAGPPRLLADTPWTHPGGTPRQAPAVAMGVVLAVPVLLVFGALLAAADPVMDVFIRSLFSWDLDAVVAHLLLFGATAWVAAGALWRIAQPRSGPVADAAPPRRALGVIELGIPLGALTLLLTVFIGIQSRYLFGGEAVVRVTGISYAAFARRGFFELVVLSALVTPVLLAAQAAVDRGARAAVESVRALAVAIVILVALVMLSAVGRMRLYVGAYGLTEDRFYATAFMVWLAVVFCWFLVTEARNRRPSFVPGAVAAGFLLLAALNAANPDAVITRVNLDRAAAGAELDTAYLGRLSADAVPTLAARWSRLDAATRCALERRASEAGDGRDWRAWTWSSWRAQRAVRGGPPAVGCGTG